MGQRHRSAARGERAEHHVHDQEVVRATRELAAYFKGQRTEREARAALKIIKAFIRDREGTPPANRRPLPGFQPEKPERERKRKKPRVVKRADEPAIPDEPAPDESRP